MHLHHLGAFWITLGKLARKDGMWLPWHAAAMESLRKTTTLLMPLCDGRACASIAYDMARAGLLSQWCAL
eukprot:10076433-Karenia_brevis.AAC.1